MDSDISPGDERQVELDSASAAMGSYMTAPSAAAAAPPLPPRVQAYLEALVRTCAGSGGALVSVILFGSAVRGGFSAAASDVDLILIVPDEASKEDRRRVRENAERIEALHGFRTDTGRPPGRLEALVEKLTGNASSFFVCTRGDLLSGRIGRILALRPAQALFVDRVVLASIMASAVTAWGEELLPRVPVPPIRRFDVFKALFGFSCQVLLSVAVFPVLPGATRYAMGALKRSLHNCYFCYHARSASLEAEIAFFQRRLGPSGTLVELLALRREYRRSFPFVLRCLPTLVRLHLQTASDNRSPRSKEPRHQEV